MYALISWSSKNGVALGREELEVRSSTKLTVMNGGKMEPGAIVNMLFRKEIWGARFNHSMVSSSVIYLTSLKLVTKFVNPSDLLAYCVACSLFSGIPQECLLEFFIMLSYQYTFISLLFTSARTINHFKLIMGIVKKKIKYVHNQLSYMELFYLGKRS